MQCLNLKNKEVKAAVDELTTVLGSEDAAYYIISENNGYAIDQAPDGAQSTVFLRYLKDFNGSREAAVKAMIQHYIPETADDYYYNTFQDLFNAAFNKLTDYVNIKYGIVIKFIEDDYDTFQDSVSELLDIEM